MSTPSLYADALAAAPAARYALQFMRARWQRRGAIRLLGAEIRAETTELDAVLGLLAEELGVARPDRCAIGLAWDPAGPLVIALRDADGELLAASTPTDVVVAPAVTIVFGPLGSTDLGADQTITVDTFALTVHAESGYVDTP